MEDDKEESPYIKLISAENCEIFLERRVALQVEMLRAMLEGNFRESEEGVIRFPDMSASALEKVVKYLHYKDRYSNTATRIPEFAIEPEEVRIFNRRDQMVYAWGVAGSAFVLNICVVLLICICAGFGVISCSELSELLTVEEMMYLLVFQLIWILSILNYLVYFNQRKSRWIIISRLRNSSLEGRCVQRWGGGEHNFLKYLEISTPLSLYRGRYFPQRGFRKESSVIIL
ncbi:hypothetical protein ACHAXR_005786 [Thalassiosira sp. AJA248-18]